MWCRLPYGGQAFSKGVADTMSGTTDWKSFEIPFVLQKDERPDLFKLNVHIEGTGTLWVKDIEIRQAPLPAELRRPSNVKTPAGFTPEAIKSFTHADKPLSAELVKEDEKGWRIDAKKRQTIPLFEFKDMHQDDCVLTYRAQMKSAGLKGNAYLEMWCHLRGDPDDRESFSKGLMLPVSGTTDWASYETPFYLEKGQHPDRIKLNVVVEGEGKVW